MNQDINLFQLPIGQPCQVFDCSEDSDDEFLKPHRHDYHELVWCLDSRGTQTIDFKVYENKPGRIFTISTGQVHESDMLENSVKLIIFVTDFIDNRPRQKWLLDKFFSHQVDRPPYIDTTDEAMVYLNPLFELLLEENARETPNWNLIESLIISFLHYAVRYSCLDTLQDNERDPRISQLLDLIDKNFKQEKQCDFYSRSMSITNKRINELVRANLGKTVTSLIHERIILEANRDLAFSTKTVKNIALDLGFEDPSYFGRFYLKQMGSSPIAFRKRTFK